MQFVLIAFHGKCQPTSYKPFPEGNARWSYAVEGIDSNSGQTYYHSYQLKMYGDTLINGILYHKIYKSTQLSYPFPLGSLHCFLRQDTSTRKVFVRYPFNSYQDSTEQLIYDFGLHSGDTFMFKLLPNNTLHTYLVDTVEEGWSTNIDLRRIFFTSFPSGPPPLCWGGNCDYSVGWIEGIGSTLYLLYNELPESFCVGRYIHTACFWVNGTYVYGGFNCDFSTSIDDIGTDLNKLSEFYIFPNPLTNDSRIFHDSKKNQCCYLLYNSIGVQLAIFPSTRLDNIIPFALNLQTGIYYLTEECSIGSKNKTKLVVIH